MNELERQILEASPPEPPQDLRERVLAATMPCVRPDDGRLDRIWYSRACRLAAMAALVALLGADTLVRRVADANEPADGPPPESMQAAERIGHEVGLGPRESETFALRLLAPPRPADGQEKNWQMLAGESR